MSGWFVLYCQPRLEDKAWIGLVDQGFDVYQPMRVIMRRHRRRRELCRVELPLFPRYMFLRQFPDDDHLSWWLVRRTQGVHSAIVRNGVPAVVSADVIDELRTAEREGAFEQKVSGGLHLVAGQDVKIVDGPFSGQMAIVQRVVSRDSAKVLMNLFGGQRSARLPIDALRVVA